MTKILIEIDTDTQAVVPMDLMRRIEDYLSTERVSAGESLYNDVLGAMMAAATQTEQAQQSDKDRLRFRSACEISGDKHPEYVRGYEAAMDAVCKQQAEPVRWMYEDGSVGDIDCGPTCIPLYAAPQAQPAPRPIPTSEQALVEALTQEFPLLDDDGLDETEHHCEWAMQQDRKRLHRILAMCSSHQPTGLTRPAEPGGE